MTQNQPLDSESSNEVPVSDLSGEAGEIDGTRIGEAGATDGAVAADGVRRQPIAEEAPEASKGLEEAVAHAAAEPGQVG